MTQVTVKGCCWALLLVIVALHANRHKAFAQSTSDQFTTADNELPISLTVIAGQLTQLMKSMTELQQENALMSQYIVEIMRHQVQSDTASAAQFELVKRAGAETKIELTAVKELLLKRVNTDNVTHSLINGLIMNYTEIESKLQSDMSVIKERFAQNSTVVGLDELRRECAQMEQDTKADIADVKTYLRQLSANNAKNETLKRIEQLNQGHIQIKTDLVAALTDVKQQLLQQLNATTESLRIARLHMQYSGKPRDCSEIPRIGLNSSGTYTVYVGSELRPVLVYCDMTTDNGGWTVFQRRRDGSENFYRNWTDYATGFGDLHREFWLGNDNIHALTTNGLQYKLRVDLADFNGNTRYAEYSNFKIGAPLDKYKLVSLGEYSGNAGDSLAFHVGCKFSTFDQDNDNHETHAVAVVYHGAWWYNNYRHSNLNGHYCFGQHQSYFHGVVWSHWTGHEYSLRFTEMKIRPMNH